MTRLLLRNLFRVVRDIEQSAFFFYNIFCPNPSYLRSSTVRLLPERGDPEQIQLNDPTLSREARLSVGFYFFESGTNERPRGTEVLPPPPPHSDRHRDGSLDRFWCGSSVGAPRRVLWHTSRGFVVRRDWVRLNHPTLSREARLSVGFRFFESGANGRRLRARRPCH